MKKSALLLLLLATVVAGQAGIVITTKVTVGRASRGCYGAGLCRVETSTENQAHGLVRMELVEERDQLRVTFSPETVQSFPEEMKNELSQGFFSQPESLPLSAEVSTALGARQPLTVQAGRYEVRRSGRDLIVVFALSSHKA
jgi:hypothetical protein